MFKQVMKKIGVIFLALTLLILDLTLSRALPLLTQDGKFSLVEQIGYGVWALGSLAIFIVIAYRFKLLSLKEINWRRLVAIASLNLVIFFLGDLLGYFVGQLTHNAAMEHQDTLKKKITDKYKDSIEWIEITDIGTKYEVKIVERKKQNNNVIVLQNYFVFLIIMDNFRQFF